MNSSKSARIAFPLNIISMLLLIAGVCASSPVLAGPAPGAGSGFQSSIHGSTGGTAVAPTNSVLAPVQPFKIKPSMVNVPKIDAATTPTKQSCVVSYTALGKGNDDRNALVPMTTEKKGGILCPGKYLVRSSCLVNTGSCGGRSCAWDACIISKETNACLNSHAWHNGCVTSYGNICQHKSNVTITIQDLEFNPDVTTLRSIAAWPEGGSVTECIAVATRIGD